MLRIRHIVTTIVLLTLTLLGLPSSPVAALTSMQGDNSPQTGSVTVHCMKNDPVSASPVPNIVFSLFPVTGVDLGTPEGKQTAASYIKDPSLANGHLGTAVELPMTDAQGISPSGDLPLGLYMLRQVSVSETGVPSYKDMVFILPSADTSNGSDVVAYKLDLYPKTVVANSEATVPPATAPNTTPGTPPLNVPPNVDAGNGTIDSPPGNVPSDGVGKAGAQTGEAMLESNMALVFVGLTSLVLALLIGVGHRRKEEKESGV